LASVDLRSQHEPHKRRATAMIILDTGQTWPVNRQKIGNVRNKEREVEELDAAA
jgi:hypothetical protein